MTIAIVIKVEDGVVLAADSASTLVATGAQGDERVLNVYNNAEKVFNLCEGLPVGGLAWGAGSIGRASISTLAKDLRKRLTGWDKDRADWALDPNSYSLEALAARTRQFLYEEKYRLEYEDPYQHQYEDLPSKPSLGLIVAGYSAGDDLAEAWQIEIIGGECSEPTRLSSREDVSLTWRGQPEAITRLIMGHGTGLATVLSELGVPDDQLGPAMERIRRSLQAPLLEAPMPVQDAIDLAEFLAHTTIMFSRFSPGAATVGGPIQIAAITKHEGFKWIRRIRYYDPALNPGIGD
jgi:hypothetical protein